METGLRDIRLVSPLSCALPNSPLAFDSSQNEAMTSTVILTL